MEPPKWSCNLDRWSCSRLLKPSKKPPDLLDVWGNWSSKNWLLKSNWLVVSAPLKNISQNGNLPQVGVKIKHVWNHHLANLFGIIKTIMTPDLCDVFFPGIPARWPKLFATFKQVTLCIGFPAASKSANPFWWALALRCFETWVILQG